MSESLKVFCAGLMHESHSFCPIPADLATFKSTGGILVGDEVRSEFHGTRSELGAIFDLSDRLGWSLLHPLFAHTVPSGPVTAETFHYFSAIIEKELVSNLPVDGVILVLHGAMLVDGLDDAEGELLRRVRELIGPETPIAVTFDLHGNIGTAVAEQANIVSSYRTTPHVDQYEAALRAGELLQRTMAGEINPRVAYAQLPMFDALDMGRTIAGHGPMVGINRLAAQEIENHPSILDIAIHAGFDWADKYSTGPSVLVTYDGDETLAQSVADQLIEYAWQTKAEKTVDMLGIDEVIRIAREPATSKGPLLIGDFTDCPGGAGMGDNTNMLKALIEARIEGVVVASIADPAAVEKCLAAGVNTIVELELGGRLHAIYSGRPLHVTARVLTVSDGVAFRAGPYFTGTRTYFGPSCLVDIEGVRVIIATEREQIDDRAQLRIFGIDPDEENILVCKAVNHFRADFEPISRRLIYVDSGGVVSRNFKQFAYRKIRRPIWPLDVDARAENPASEARRA
ncbi:M81 family metallopeptidase [Ensifer canadensis]